MMADSTNPLPDFDLSQVDRDHLARQALQLFRKRYGTYYDTHLEVLDVEKKGYVTREEFYRVYENLSEYTPLEEFKDLAEQSWLFICAGRRDTTQLSRKSLIGLWINGFHSKDREHVKLLEDLGTKLNRFFFDQRDTNHDGFISYQEYIAVAKARGMSENWKEEFASLDLNGDGLVDRKEFLECMLGFFFHIDDERYNHFFGVVKENNSSSPGASK